MVRRVVHVVEKDVEYSLLLQQFQHRVSHAFADEIVSFGVVVPVIALSAGGLFAWTEEITGLHAGGRALEFLAGGGTVLGGDDAEAAIDLLVASAKPAHGTHGTQTDSTFQRYSTSQLAG